MSSVSLEVNIARRAVFVQMFKLRAHSPELAQTAYRIGGTTTNVMSLMMTYFALIVAFVEGAGPLHE